MYMCNANLVEENKINNNNNKIFFFFIILVLMILFSNEYKVCSCSSGPCYSGRSIYDKYGLFWKRYSVVD